VILTDFDPLALVTHNEQQITKKAGPPALLFL
jgi:hypothetical protein